MVEDQNPDAKHGLKLNEIVPDVNQKDILGNSFNLLEICKENKGVLVSFIRGTW
jgi:hypothetical protein